MKINMNAKSVVKAKSIWKTLKSFNLKTTNAMLMKQQINTLVTSLFGKILEYILSCVRGHKQKISQNKQNSHLFASISTFLNTPIKTVAYLMHHLVCHHWSNFKQNWQHFGEFWSKNYPKTDSNDSFCWYENIWKFKTIELQIQYH